MRPSQYDFNSISRGLQRDPQSKTTLQGLATAADLLSFANKFAPGLFEPDPNHSATFDPLLVELEKGEVRQARAPSGSNSCDEDAQGVGYT